MEEDVDDATLQNFMLLLLCLFTELSPLQLRRNVLHSSSTICHVLSGGDQLFPACGWVPRERERERERAEAVMWSVTSIVEFFLS